MPGRDPLRDLLFLQEQMNGLLEQGVRRGSREPTGPGWLPAADVVETPDGFVVEVELPGLAREDIEIETTAHELTLRGRRRTGEELRHLRFQRMERSYGPFSRTFRLPAEIVAGQVTAELDDGVLRLSLPKKTASRRVVPVEPR